MFVPTKHLARQFRPLTRKSSVLVAIKTDVSHTGTAWSGGSISSYRAIDLASGIVSPWSSVDQFTPGTGFPAFQAATSKTSPGRGVYQSGTTSGKPAIIGLFVHPGDLWQVFGLPKADDSDVVAQLLEDGKIDDNAARHISRGISNEAAK